MRLPKKRELAALYILYSRGNDLNYLEAVELVKNNMCMNKKTARNVIKRLRKIGAITVYKAGGELRVKVMSPWEFLERKLQAYIESKAKRCMGPGEEGRTLREGEEAFKSRRALAAGSRG